MEFVGFPKISRFSRECIVTEKIDGTNAQIYIVPEEDISCHASMDTNQSIAFSPQPSLFMFAGSRTQYITFKNDNHGFAKWAIENSDELFRLGPGRHFGEWWGQGIQRNYGLKEKRFSLFNVKRWGDDLVRPACCYVVPVITHGILGEINIENILFDLDRYGSHAAPGFRFPEGIIIHHVAANISFKKTILKDDEPKSREVHN